MIRLTALWLVVGGLAVYARRDWFVSLCGLILLMAVIEHPDAPKTMFGIQGLNFWNLLLAVVCYFWWAERTREGRAWDIPREVLWLLAAYGGVMAVAFSRMFVDRSYLEDQSTAALVSEYLINTGKWVVPALLLFDGARTRRRFEMATASVLGVYLLLALYVIKWMPLGFLNSGDELQARALKVLVNEVGYHRVTMSMMLAGASWAIFSTRNLVSETWQRAVLFGAVGAVILAQALTGGRMGYATWAAVGLLLLTIRGRGYLALAPVAALGVWLLVPAVGERIMEGITPDSRAYAMRAAQATGDLAQLESVDMDTMTAGRTLIWPYVQERIAAAPVFGYGMLAMQRIGLTHFLATSLGEGFAHPHNAYFEVLLDSGAIGLLLVLPFYALVLARALSLYADGRSPVFTAAGGMAAALVMALLVASIGSQSFYPREGTVGMWCAIGLMMRVWVERERALRAPLTSHVAAVAPPSPARVVSDGRLYWPGSAPAATDATPASPAPVTVRQAEVPLSVDGRLWGPS